MVGISDKRREWLENISALKKKKEQELADFEDKKKKELDELEKKKSKELKEADEILKASVEELTEEEIIEERKKSTAPTAIQGENLEETIAAQKVPEVTDSGPIYQTPIEDTVQQIYQRSDYNVYNDLAETLQKVQRGDYLSAGERESFYHRAEQFNKLEEEAGMDPLFLQDKDPQGYISRSRSVINSIQQTLSDKSLYK